MTRLAVSAPRGAMIGAALICGLSACTTRGEFAAFATLGSSYTQMLPSVAQDACRSWIDTSSWKLVDDATLARVRPAHLEAVDAGDASYCTTTDRLAAHAGVLGQYFGMLQAMASANQSGEVGAAIGGLAQKLQETGDALRLSAGIDVSPDNIASITNLIVNEAIEARLRRELIARKDLLAKELATLDLVLATLAAEVEAEQAQVRTVRYQVQVADPLTQGRVSDPGAVVEARRLALGRAGGGVSLRPAQQAAAELRASFETLLRVDPDDAQVAARLKALAAKLASLRAAIAAFRT